MLEPPPGQGHKAERIRGGYELAHMRTHRARLEDLVSVLVEVPDR